LLGFFLKYRDLPRTGTGGKGFCVGLLKGKVNLPSWGRSKGREALDRMRK